MNLKNIPVVALICQTRLQKENLRSRHSLVGQVVKPAEDTLMFELSSCPEGGAVLAHPQPGNMNAPAWQLPAADHARAQSDTKVLAHATWLLVCLQPSGSAACTGSKCQNPRPAANSKEKMGALHSPADGTWDAMHVYM